MHRETYGIITNDAKRLMIGHSYTIAGTKEEAIWFYIDHEKFYNDNTSDKERDRLYNRAKNILEKKLKNKKIILYIF